MNFNQLRYIIAVEKYRSFAQAARECHIAQSTISKEIQRLEQEYGVMIFDRSRLPITPTMKGEDLIDQAKLILGARERFEEIALKRENMPVGTFKMGILPMLAPYLIPLFVNSLADKYPDLRLEIVEVGARELALHLEREELDGGIVLSPFAEDGFYEDLLFEEKFVLYIDPQHPLAAKDEVEWEDISAENLILQEDIHDYFYKPTHLGKESEFLKGKLPNVRFQSGSLETIRKIIDRNGGMTLLPELSTLYMGNRRLKMVRKLVNPVIKRNVVLVTPRGFQKNRITKVIKQEIQGNLPTN